jgi:hypothetical protein
MSSTKPAFIITIDTEPDNQWTYLTYDRMENLRFIPRFQELCERYDFKPVYLTEYHVAKDPFFIEYISSKVHEGKCEIGAHLHSWSTPPISPLTDNDCREKPFLIDFRKNIMRSKFANLAELLRNTFNTEIISHRSGRWAFSTEYLEILKEFGFKIDCSVLPKHILSPSSVVIDGEKVDFTSCPNVKYEMSLTDFTRPGSSGVFEVPLTVYDEHPILRTLSAKISTRISNRRFGLTKLRPERGNLPDLLKIISDAERRKSDYIEFMLHSSEFMPGCSLAFPDEESIENMYDDLSVLFDAISKNFQGKTLREYVFPET